MDQGRFTWGGISNVTAGDIHAPERSANQKTEAVDFLRDLLADGPMMSKDVEAQAKENGISLGTLKRAKKHLNVKAESVRQKGSQVAGWRLSLRADP